MKFFAVLYHCLLYDHQTFCSPPFSSLHRGLSPLSDEEVLRLYDGTHHVPLHQVSGFYGKASWLS